MGFPVVAECYDSVVWLCVAFASVFVVVFLFFCVYCCVLCFLLLLLLISCFCFPSFLFVRVSYCGGDRKAESMLYSFIYVSVSLSIVCGNRSLTLPSVHT